MSLQEIATQVMSSKTKEQRDAIAYGFEPNRIYHTHGVYKSLQFKDNGVPGRYLAEHIEYNIVMRFGRALFVDSVCFNKGYLSEQECQEQAQKLVGIKASRDTQPYQ